MRKNSNLHNFLLMLVMCYCIATSLALCYVTSAWSVNIVGNGNLVDITSIPDSTYDVFDDFSENLFLFTNIVSPNFSLSARFCSQHLYSFSPSVLSAVKHAVGLFQSIRRFFFKADYYRHTLYYVFALHHMRN